MKHRRKRKKPGVIFFFFPLTENSIHAEACTGFRRDKTSGIHKRQHQVFPKYSWTYGFAQLHSRVFSFSIRKHEKLPSGMNLQQTSSLRAQKAALSVTALTTPTTTAQRAFPRKIRPLRPDWSRRPPLRPGRDEPRQVRRQPPPHRVSPLLPTGRQPGARPYPVWRGSHNSPPPKEKKDSSRPRWGDHGPSRRGPRSRRAARCAVPGGRWRCAAAAPHGGPPSRSDFPPFGGGEGRRCPWQRRGGGRERKRRGGTSLSLDATRKRRRRLVSGGGGGSGRPGRWVTAGRVSPRRGGRRGGLIPGEAGFPGFPGAQPPRRPPRRGPFQPYPVYILSFNPFFFS